MAINFSYYPTSNRVPGVFVEMDPSQANTATVLQNTLLLGQIVAAGTAVVDEPLLVQSKAQVLEVCGNGSMLAAMADRYLDRDPFGPLYILPLADNPSGVAATGTIAIAGTATANGTLNVYIAGVRVQLAVSTGDAAGVVAGDLATAINATANLPVKAAAAAGTVTLTANNAGETGNDIDLQQDYLGTAGGEYPVAGITLTFTAMSGGTGNPDFSNALANLSSQAMDFVCCPYSDTASLDLLKDFFADDVGRWSWEQMIYGMAFTAFRGTLGECTALGLTRNDQHMSITAFQG
jgi:phage tail sheath gpL-like